MIAPQENVLRFEVIVRNLGSMHHREAEEQLLRDRGHTIARDHVTADRLNGVVERHRKPRHPRPEQFLGLVLSSDEPRRKDDVTRLLRHIIARHVRCQYVSRTSSEKEARLDIKGSLITSGGCRGAPA